MSFEFSFEKYLIMVGIRSAEYTYSDEELYNNINHFKECYDKNIGAYTALLLLSDNLMEESNVNNE